MDGVGEGRAETELEGVDCKPDVVGGEIEWIGFIFKGRWAFSSKHRMLSNILVNSFSRKSSTFSCFGANIIIIRNELQESSYQISPLGFLDCS